MPASPAEPLPRRKLSKTVSAWSSAVCATSTAVAPSSGCGGRAARPGAGIEEHTLSEQREELVGALETELPPDAAKARVHVAATDAELLRDGGDRRAGGERLEELSLLRGELADPLARSTDAGRGTGRRRRMLEAGEAHARPPPRARRECAPPPAAGGGRRGP